jgi:hypothetical protein
MARTRQQTQAKAARERAVRERRERKLEKRRLASALRKDAGGIPDTEPSADRAAERP